MRSLRSALVVGALLAIAVNTVGAQAVTQGVTLVGKGLVPGTGVDKSGLTGDICQAGNAANCVPAAILGGFGSDIDYSGHDNVYVAAPDRGPFDGLTDVPYQDRVNFFHIRTRVGAAYPNIDVTLLDTRILRNEQGAPFVGGAGVFDNRFDPEGIRVAPDGTVYEPQEHCP